MSTCFGVGKGAARAAEATKSARNVITDRGRIRHAGHHGCFEEAAHFRDASMCQRRISSQIGGFDRRTTRPIYDRSELRKTFGPVRIAGDWSETPAVLNKFGASGHGEAQVQYLD